MTKLSIITAVHNQLAVNQWYVEHLKRCTQEPYELIIIDNASTDGSAEFFDVHRLNLREKTQRATFVRCISNFCKAQVMAWSNPGTWDRFHVVHCAVDPDVLTPLPSRKELGEGSSLRLITVGRLDPIKGYPLLLDALTKVVKTNANVHLTMVGSGPLEQLL